MDAGIIDVNGDLMPPYQKSLDELENPVDEWRSEGNGVLFF